MAIDHILLNKEKYRKWNFISKNVTLHTPFKVYGSNGVNNSVIPLTVSVNELDLNLNTIVTFSNGDSVKMANKDIFHRMLSNYGHTSAFKTKQNNDISLLENNPAKEMFIRYMYMQDVGNNYVDIPVDWAKIEINVD